VAANIQIIVDAINRASAELAKIGKDTDALNKSSKESASIGEQVAEAFEHQAAALLGVGTAAGATAAIVDKLVEGVFEAVKAVAEFVVSTFEAIESLNQMSLATGLSIEALSTLQFAFARSNVSASDFEQGMRRLSIAIIQAKEGTGQGAIAFERLGININDASFRLKNNEQILFEVADGFSKIEDRTLAVQLATELLGRTGPRFLQSFADGAEGLKKLQQAARDLNLEISALTAEQADKLNTQLAILKLSARGLADVLAKELLPSLLNIVGTINQIVGPGTAAGKILEFIGDRVKTIATEGVSLGQLFKTLSEVVPVALTAIQAVNENNVHAFEFDIKRILEILDKNKDELKKKVEDIFGVGPSLGREDVRGGGTLSPQSSPLPDKRIADALAAQTAIQNAVLSIQKSFLENEEAQVKISYDRRLVTIDEAAKIQIRTAKSVSDIEIETLQNNAELQKAQEDAKRGTGATDLEIANAKKKIDADTNAAIVANRLQLQTKLSTVDSDTEKKHEDLLKSAADLEIKSAQDAGNEQLTLTLQQNEKLRDLLLQRATIIAKDPNAKVPTQEQINLDQTIAKETADLALKLKILEAQKQLVASHDENALKLIDASTANDIEKATARIPLLEEQIQLKREEISAELDAARNANVSEPARRDHLQKVVDLTSQLIDKQIQLRQQADATVLPQFQSELGIKSTFDVFGNVTGRDFTEPFRALDTFLSTTLKTTFQGLSDAITGLITGTKTWAQVSTQVLNSIIGGVVQLILEYTIFNQIRTFLDTLFHTTSRTNMAGTAAVGEGLKATSTATSVAQSGAVAAAAAPAAAATSIFSFGSSAQIGLVLALAAIAGIVAALAFEEGGVVPGPRSDKDNQLAWVASGEFIIPSRVVANLGTAHFQQYLNGGVPNLPNHYAGGGVVPDISNTSLSESALFAPNVSVSPSTVENNVVVLDSISKVEQYIQSKRGRTTILDIVKGSKTEIGIIT
jgi:hypothetical protein